MKKQVGDVKENYIKWKYHEAFLVYYLNIATNRFIGRDITKFDKPVMSKFEGNRMLFRLIESEVPFAAVRYGGTEARTIADVLYSRAGGRIGGVSNNTVKRIVNLSGFFPNDKNQLNDFVDLYLDCAKDVDVLSVWNVIMQEYLADTITPNAVLGQLTMLEPYYFDSPWSSALKDRKVVVVHPFSETIKKQYEKRERLFCNKTILPEFDLRVVKAVQTLAGIEDNRFDSWFDALEHMFNEVMSKEFDIALIGCGAYGFPLAVKIKRAGRQAVHIGGALQVLFGIKGNRWDNNETISGLYNDAWVRPDERDRIVGSENVENSCYW